MESPSILVTCKYGLEPECSKGIWIDATESVAGMESKIQDHLSRCCNESCTEKEWAISASDGFFGIEIEGEISNLEDIHELASFLQQYGKVGALVFRDSENDLLEAREIIRSPYYGQFKDVNAFLLFHAKEVHGVSDSGFNYFDLKKFELDVFVKKFFYISDCRSIHVFKYL